MKSSKEAVRDRFAFSIGEEQRSRQNTEDFNFDDKADMFKASFNFNANLTQSLNMAQWGQNSAAEFKSSQGEFNFNPIQSSFEP